jgi:hypothetical protein
LANKNGKEHFLAKNGKDAADTLGGLKVPRDFLKFDP